MANSEFATFLDEIEAEEIISAPAKVVKDKVNYPCIACSGTGNYPLRNGKVSTCFACDGSGRKELSPERQQTNKQASAKRRLTQQQNQQQNQVENCKLEIFKTLSKMSEWNTFAASLMNQHIEGRKWSDNQIAAAERMIAKCESSKKAKVENAPEVNLQTIVEMFSTAKGNGYKSPKYRAEDLIISLAPSHGVNSGSLYVKTSDGEYKGKITPDQKFIGKNDILDNLMKIAENPKESAVRWGRQTGKCSCCGRTLTNKASIEAGIGPICEANYF